jgi:hypothetical protein
LDGIPHNVDQLAELAVHTNTAVFYTIWSYAAGAGRRLIEEAQQIWASCFNPSRSKQTEQKIPNRLQFEHKRKFAETSAAAWLRKRRNLVAAAASSNTNASRLDGASTQHDINMAADSVWSDQHEKEVSFQRAAKLERHCAAVQEGSARLSSLGPRASELMVRFVEKESNRQSELEAKRRKFEIASKKTRAFRCERDESVC